MTTPTPSGRYCIPCSNGRCEKCEGVTFHGECGCLHVRLAPSAPSVETARCPECDCLVADHANGERPDSTARVMRGCTLTEAQARQCYEANERWKYGGWPVVLAAAVAQGRAEAEADWRTRASQSIEAAKNVRTETIRECREKVAELRPHYDGIFPYGRVAAKDVFAIFDALGGQP